MGPKQIAGVMSLVRRGQAARKGLEFDEDADAAITAQVEHFHELKSLALYSTGRVADDGRLTLEGRAGDMIISGGENIYPKEIEVVTEKLRATWDGITTACAEDSFEPRTGPLCGWCPYVDRCPEGAKEAEKRNRARAAEDASLLSAAG